MDVLDYDAITWSPYSDEVLAQLPEICVAGMAIWTARVPLIHLKDVFNHLPDRVMRQFRMWQHIPDGAPLFRTEYVEANYQTALQIWNQRHALF